jgi:hypothetical protein
MLFVYRLPAICTVHFLILKFSYSQSIFRHVPAVATTIVRELTLQSKTPLLKLPLDSNLIKRTVQITA